MIVYSQFFFLFFLQATGLKHRLVRADKFIANRFNRVIPR